ncbi:MAG: GNAT family N-acetyltransferase [Saprospiraceae bacterium]|nr:GNAT family N-acetyltransferase [Saprospiraceae bacterium]
MIRKYQSTDRSQVIKVFRQNTPKYFALEEQTDLEQFLEHNGANYWLIEQEGIIAGCGGIVFSEDQQVGRIAWDFFSPNFQGKGLGRALTEFRLAEIRKNRSVQRIIVRTSQLAYSFYAKFGFDIAKIEEDYWAPGLHLYDMQMPA